MALAIHNQHIYAAAALADLAKAFPSAAMLLNDERDLVLASDSNDPLIRRLQKILPEQLLRQLMHYGNHAKAWYAGLEIMAEPIKTPDLKNSFTSSHKRAIVPLTKEIIHEAKAKKAQSMTTGTNAVAETAEEKKKREHLDKNLKIVKLLAENPRREGTAGHKSWSVIKEGMTVAEFLAAGGRSADLKWDIAKGFAKLV